MKTFFISLILCFCLSPSSRAQSSAWDEGALIPPGGRPNPYELTKPEHEDSVRAGRIHAQVYPVSSTGILPPYEPLKKFFESDSADPFRRTVRALLRRVAKVEGLNDVFRWIGLQPYPRPTDEGIYAVPYPEDLRPDTLLGLGLMEKDGAVGFTLSCATCHASHLFGKTVLGLTNRFPRANEAFRTALFAAPFYHSHGFQKITGASDAEMDLMDRSVRNLRSVGVKKPLALGLDTSLAQVALSLNRRSPDAYATKSAFYEKHPRADRLDRWPADSKPAVWWNLKYKNRWLSDGSVVSGNPVFTNILWNEIGRGADLHEIDDWLDRNPKTIQELTTAVFSTEAPPMSDFFDPDGFDLPRAKEGQALFNGTCARCHGVYEKAWDRADASSLSKKELLETTLVRYHQKTPVIDVGTDPLRYQGMTSLEKLNELTVSQKQGTVIKPQKGYVPPPLVGIWSRWPYFHNNSAPSLCAVLTRGPDRPVVYYSGEAKDPRTDFDKDCNGYPLGEKIPKSWITRDHRYDTRQAGMSRFGHDEGVFLKNGRELFTPDQKKSIIHFLQTL